MSGNALQTELQLYLREVKRVPLLTAEEEKELGWRIINDNDLAAKERMIRANLRLVIAIGKNDRDLQVTLRRIQSQRTSPNDRRRTLPRTRRWPGPEMKKEADLDRPKGLGKGVFIYTLTRKGWEAVADQPKGGKRADLTRPFP